jgi:hypothetical protein
VNGCATVALVARAAGILRGIGCRRERSFV